MKIKADGILARHSNATLSRNSPNRMRAQEEEKQNGPYLET